MIVVAQLVALVKAVEQLLGARWQHVRRIAVTNGVGWQPGEEVRQYLERVADDGPHAGGNAKPGVARLRLGLCCRGSSCRVRSFEFLDSRSKRHAVAFD